MKKSKCSSLIIFLATFLTTKNSMAQNTTEPCSSGCSVGFIQWDLRANAYLYAHNTNAAIQFSVSDGGERYLYFFDANNPVSISKANQVYSTLLTAKSTGALIGLSYDLCTSSATQKCVTMLYLN